MFSRPSNASFYLALGAILAVIVFSATDASAFVPCQETGDDSIPTCQGW